MLYSKLLKYEMRVHSKPDRRKMSEFYLELQTFSQQLEANLVINQTHKCFIKTQKVNWRRCVHHLQKICSLCNEGTYLPTCMEHWYVFNGSQRKQWSSVSEEGNLLDPESQKQVRENTSFPFEAFSMTIFNRKLNMNSFKSSTNFLYSSVSSWQKLLDKKKYIS